MHGTMVDQGIGAVFNSRWRGDQCPPLQLHNESFKQEEFGDRYRVSDLFHKCAIEHFLSKVLIIKI